MKPYSQLSKEELTALKKELEKQFEDVKGKGLKLDMSRGKPAKAQLDLSNGMMDILNSETDLVSSDGVDVYKRQAETMGFWTVSVMRENCWLI